MANAGQGICDNMVEIKGEVVNLQVGPLMVRGTVGPKAILDFMLKPTSQHLIIDGQVILFDMMLAIYVNVKVLPNPKFELHL